MGSDPNEGARSGRKARKPAEAAIDFWSWHPTVAERTQFEMFAEEHGDALAALEGAVVRGIAISITRARTNDSFAVVAREAGASFGQGQALSVFHVELERAVLGMVFVLDVLYPHWPAERVRTGNRQIDW